MWWKAWVCESNGVYGKTKGCVVWENKNQRMGERRLKDSEKERKEEKNERK